MSQLGKNLRLAALLGALLGASCDDPKGGVPTGFGVNITVVASALPAATRTALARVELRASGVETATKTLTRDDFDATGVARVRFVPTQHTGAVTLDAEGFDAQSARVAIGRAMDVMLEAQAVNATLTLMVPPPPQSVALGGACAATSDCADAVACLDGVCCGVASCGPCRACGADGACSVKITDQEDGPDCAGTHTCDSNGDCKLNQGQMCMVASAAECLSGSCVDGVCCENACEGPCRTCDAGGSCQVLALMEVNACLIGVAGAMMCDPVGDCQPPHLIDDLNTALFAATTNTLPSSPSEFVQGPNGRIYFAATDGNGGRELWATDGTKAGTSRVIDIQPGGASSNPRHLVAAGGLLYFKAEHPSGKGLIFRSDGTEAGTVPVSISFTGTGEELVAFKDSVYFSATDATSGAELWKTSGANTVLVKDIIPAGVGSSPQRLTAATDQLFFLAADQTATLGVNIVPANFEIWRTDGTAAGTSVTKDLIPGNTAYPGVLSMAALGNDLLFSANVISTTATELYKTDGTAAGTVLVKDINPSGGSDPTQITAVGNQVFFSATLPATGRELYRSDGTDAGTFLVKDIFASGDSFPSNLTAVGNQLFFAATDPANGEELWRSDGTTGGTVLVSSIAPGTTNSSPRNISAFGNRAFFSAVESLPGVRELWFTDGTPSGTAKACPNGSCLVFGNVAAQGGRLWFSGATNTSTIGDEPYVFP